MGTGQPLPLGLAILGSQIPDIDTTTSTIGKIFYPISSWIEDLGLRGGIVRIYNQNASTNKVYARITGYWTSDA